MRKNDFFKYLLLGGGGSASRVELESEILPYAFNSNSYKLRNYRIYGAEGGVGDLDSTTNKYIISLAINGQEVNIYLDSPLSDGDYIDFYEQKRFNADDSAETVFIPALQISSGINVLDVGTEVQPSKIYIKGNISTFDVSSWANVQKLVRAGLHDKYFAVGDQLVCQKGGSDLTWDIIGFDHDTPTDTQFTHSMTLQLHDCLPSTMQFDAPEALYYAESGLTAGTYCFTIQNYDTTYGGGKTYRFEIQNDIVNNAPYQLTFGWGYNTQAADAKITIYDKDGNQVGEPIGVTEGSSGESLGTTDGASTNLNHIARVRFGSNNYGESAIRQFLNSDKAAGSVWESKTHFDRPPTWNTNTAGFMSDLDSDFLAVIGNVQKVTALNTLIDGGGSVTLNDKFFLLARSEVYGGNEVSTVNEGSPYPYYSDYSDLPAAGTGTDSNRIKYRSGIAQTWWLRSAYFASGHHVRYVHTNGNINYYNFANYDLGVAPACNII